MVLFICFFTFNIKSAKMIQIYWGNGKGKTTAALGTALRACGKGFKVHLVQFMKDGAGDPEFDLPGEIKALKKLKGFSFQRFGAGRWVGSPSQEHFDKVNEAFEHLLEALTIYDLIIADEILYAVQLGLLQEARVLELLEKAQGKELILTGSHRPLSVLFKKADLVTHMKKTKHPYDKNARARRGFEY